MAKYHANLIRLTFGGTINDDEDIWSNTLHFVPADATGGQITTESVKTDYIFSSIQTMFFSGSQISSVANFAALTYVKAVRIGTDGKYDGDPKEYRKLPGVKSDFSSSARTPSDSTVISLRTDKTTGKAKRGRLYALPMSLQINPNGRIAVSSCATVASKWGQLLEDIVNNGVDGDDWSLVVASGIDGTVNPVTSIAVGDVMDVQRRRRNRIKESYASVAFDPAA